MKVLFTIRLPDRQGAPMKKAREYIAQMRGE